MFTLEVSQTAASCRVLTLMEPYKFPFLSFSVLFFDVSPAIWFSSRVGVCSLVDVRSGRRHEVNRFSLPGKPLLFQVVVDLLLRPQQLFLEPPFGKIGGVPKISGQCDMILHLLAETGMVHQFFQ